MAHKWHIGYISSTQGATFVQREGYTKVDSANPSPKKGGVSVFWKHYFCMKIWPTKKKGMSFSAEPPPPPRESLTHEPVAVHVTNSIIFARSGHGDSFEMTLGLSTHICTCIQSSFSFWISCRSLRFVPFASSSSFRVDSFCESERSAFAAAVSAFALCKWFAASACSVAQTMSPEVPSVCQGASLVAVVQLIWFPGSHSDILYSLMHGYKTEGGKKEIYLNTLPLALESAGHTRKVRSQQEITSQSSTAHIQERL